MEGCKLTLDSLDALDLEGARCTPRGDGGLRLRLRGGRRVLIRSPRKEDAKLLDAVAGACAPPTVEDLVAACREAAPTGPAEPPQRLLLTDDASDGDEAGADDAGADVCPVCLEALWRRPVAFFADAGRGRACPHFLHATCAAQIDSISSCSDGVAYHFAHDCPIELTTVPTGAAASEAATQAMITAVVADLKGAFQYAAQEHAKIGAPQVVEVSA